MKKNILRLTAMGLCVTMLAGCNGETQRVAERTITGQAGAAGKARNESMVTASLSAAGLKDKYKEEDKYEYTDPMYQLDPDHVFTYEVTDELFQANEVNAFHVYYDSKFENEANIRIESDYDNHLINIRPGLMFDYNDPQGNIAKDNTWGSRTKFWLVQTMDLQTGEKLKRPIVTVFSVKKDMNTPTLRQDIAGNGEYRLSWSKVEGAKEYEVYHLDKGMDFAQLEYTTEGTECTSEEFQTAVDYREHFKKTYKGTEVDTDAQWLMNVMMDTDDQYFVVAKNGKKASGMSNTVEVEDIANQIPYKESDTFVDEYQGEDALALPVYVDVEMLDGSIGQFVIEYHGANAVELKDHSIMVDPAIKNLPISMQAIKLTGAEYDKFMETSKDLTKRQDDIAVRPGKTDEKVDIPFVPDQDTDLPQTADQEEDKKKSEAPKEEKKEDKKEEVVQVDGAELPENVAKTVRANSALSDWIARNLLAHNETIDLSEFSEVNDTELLFDTFVEAAKQNPLCGTYSYAQYDYAKNALSVEYVQSKEEVEKMQQECLKKAQEVADELTTSDMSVYEKEVAINQYLCANASYNDAIMDYINEDGTISNEVMDKYQSSFTPYGILIENCGVCESYAEAFQLIARAAGVESMIMTGRMCGVNHEWNRVKIDDNWYILDVTNNDNEIVPDALFNLSDQEAEKILIQGNDAVLDSCMGNYTAPDMKYEYYTVNGQCASDLATAADKLAEQLKEKGNGVIRVESDITVEDIQGLVQNVADQIQGNVGGNYVGKVIGLVKQ